MISFHAQDLKALLDALQSHCSPPKESADRINYDDFCVVRDMVKDISSIALPYFTASVFLKVCLSDSSHRPAMCSACLGRICSPAAMFSRANHFCSCNLLPVSGA